MERITKWAFRNKAGIIVLVLLVLVMGVVSYFTLPKELLPVADSPEITVTVMGNGFDASSMAEQVTTPMEQALESVSGKTDITSTTADGYTSINMMFDSKTNMKDAKTEVQDAQADVTLPQGVSKPFISQLNTSMIPVADVALTFQNGVNQDNIQKVKDKIVPLFQQVQGVSYAGVYGDNPTVVTVHLDKAKMAKYHLPLQAVMGVLQGQNTSVAIGEKTIDGQSATLKVVGTIGSLDTLKSLQVVPNVRLQDIADVSAGQAGQTLVHVNGSDAVLIIIQKTGSANAVTVDQQVQKVADQVSQQYGPQIQASVPYATADMVVSSVNSMMREVLMGALFATIVILLFLRNIRMTLVTVVSIPLSLGLTLFLLSESGITLNILTLGAVAVAVGRLVDDSIVVIENIYRRSQIEGYSTDMVISSTKDVAMAITSSTLTTVAVFLPIGLVSGSLQQLLLPFALTVVYSLLSSLLVALTVVPLLSSGMLKHAKVKGHKVPRRYIRLLTWVLNYKWIPLTLTVLIFIGAIGAYIAMPKAALDTSDSSMVVVSLDYPGTASTDQVKSGAEQLEKFIMQQPQVKTSLLQVGNSSTDAKYGEMKSPTLATFNVIMKDGANADQFTKAVDGQKDHYQGATLSAFAASGFGGSNTITVDLTGDNVGNLQSAAGQVVNAVQNISGVQKVTTNQQDVKPTYEIHVDPKVANAQDIAQQLSGMLNQVPLGTMELNGQSTNVLLDSYASLTTESDLKNLYVATKSGTVVPLNTVASVEKTEKPSTVLRKDGNTYVEVSIQIDPKKLSAVQTAVTVNTAKLKLPAGVTLSTGGAATQQAGDTSDLGKTMLVAIGVVYLIMVFTFKRLRAPLVILFTLPLAAIGAVLGLMVTNTPADSSSLIGMLMLVGIVVTNAIVLIDKVRQNEATMTIRDAIVEAAATRVRPILMTAVATICAMLPLVFSHSEAGSIVSKSLAVVVIGGLMVATLLTLIIIPAGYELLHFRKSKRQRMEKLHQHSVLSAVAE